MGLLKVRLYVRLTEQLCWSPKSNHSKTSFEKICFSNPAWASTLNMGLINKVDMVFLSPVGSIWCLADVSSVSPSSEQTLRVSDARNVS